MNDKHPRLGRSEVAVVAWSGMRGPISLAAALAIPASLGHAGGQEFETVVTITAVVIVMTLLGQGAVLPALVRLLGLHSAAKADETLFRRQQALGEVEAARAALDCLAELERRGGIEAAGAARFRRVYQDRLEEASTQQSSRSSENGSGAIRSELIQAERSRILELRRDGRISDHALQRLERALDLREALID
jgi:CPA1 family monovalent cation:H+ antiporter